MEIIEHILTILISSLSYIIQFVSKLVKYIIEIEPNNDFLSDIATFEGVLIAISLPISLNVVTRATDRYNDQEISQIFIKEPFYLILKGFLLWNIGVTILFKFLDVKNKILLLIILIMLFICIYVFYKFIKLVEEYSSNTDKLLLNKFEKDVEKILKN